MMPLVLPRNTPRRFYRGGRKILAWRGETIPDDFDDHRPEDWLASTTRLFAEGGDGLAHIPGGGTLAAALAADPAGWLGEKHLKRYAADPGLLVKLLDAGERLPVHAHPDRRFAARHLHSRHGKTEAWMVLDADPDARVWLGFRSPMSSADVANLVEAQDDRLLHALHECPVSRGDAVLVPAGQPHAIGADVFALELQEPTDFSVMLEHARFGIDEDDAWLGLDPDVAQSAVDHDALSPQRLYRLRSRWDAGWTAVQSALPAAADEFFRAEVLDARIADAEVEAGFSVLVVLDGGGELATSTGGRLPVQAGQTVVTPYSCGDLTLTGDVRAVRCRPAAGPESSTDPPALRGDGGDTNPSDSEAAT